MRHGHRRLPNLRHTLIHLLRGRSGRGVIAGIIAVLSASPGCATLSAWERGRLQSRAMMDPGDPMEARATDHVWAVREAIAGASLGGGTACGCN